MVLETVAVVAVLLALPQSHAFLGNSVHDYEHHYPFPGHYYDMKPFIYTDQNGTAQGMVIDFFKELETLAHVCFNLSHVKMIDFNGNRLNGKQSFEQKFFNHFSTNSSSQNISMAGYWFPIMEDFTFSEQLYNFLRYDILLSDSIAYIQRRETVHILYKFGLSYHFVSMFLGLTFSTALLFGVVFWFIEKSKNPDFPKSFTWGSGSGIWLAFVSMTSVGYGDIAPRNPVGRFFGVIFMVFGLIVSSLMAALMTEAVNKVDILSYIHEVAAVKGSFEAELIKANYLTQIKAYDSYDDIVKALQKGEVALAVMNSDVAAYKQETWNDNVDPKDSIAVVGTVPMEIPVRLGIFRLEYTTELFNCLNLFVKKARAFVEYKYKKQLKVTTTYAPTITEFIQSNTILLYLTCGVAGMIVLGFLFDLANLDLANLIVKLSTKLKNRNKQQCEEGVEANNNTNYGGSNSIVMVTVLEADLLAIREEMKQIMESLKQNESLKIKNSSNDNQVNN